MTVARLSIGRWRSASRSQSGRTKSRHNDHTVRARRQFDHRSISLRELQPVRVCSASSWIAQAARRWMTIWGVQQLMLRKTQEQPEASSSGDCAMFKQTDVGQPLLLKLHHQQPGRRGGAAAAALSSGSCIVIRDGQSRCLPLCVATLLFRFLPRSR